MAIVDKSGFNSCTNFEFPLGDPNSQNFSIVTYEIIAYIHTYSVVNFEMVFKEWMHFNQEIWVWYDKNLTPW